MDSLGDNIIIAGKAFLDERRLKPGDEVMVSYRELFRDVVTPYTAEYKGQENYDNDTAIIEIVTLHGDQIMREIAAQSVMCTIVGVVSTASGQHDSMLFSPGLRNAATIGMPTVVEIAEYIVADNDYIEEFRENCERIADIDTIIIMDTSRIENIRNSIRVLEAISPVVISAAFLTGAFLCCLIILQSTKEAVLFRAFGTTKAKTRMVLSLEQVLLSIAGLIIGICIMFVNKSDGLAMIEESLYTFAIFYFAIIIAAASICSTLVTRRSALELLQTKE